MSRFTVCQAAGCCNLLPPPSAHNHRQKWCSDQHRKSQYVVPCPGCGTPLSGSDGRGPNAPQRCAACNSERASEASGRAVVALEMWRLREREGLLNIEIACRLGRPVHTVRGEMSRLRALGFAVPKADYRGQATRLTTATFADRSCGTLLRELAKVGVRPPDIGLPWRHPLT